MDPQCPPRRLPVTMTATAMNAPRFTATLSVLHSDVTLLKMENPGFEREEGRCCGGSTVEMSEVASSGESAAAPAAHTTLPAPSPALLPVNGTGAAACCSEYCQSLHLHHQKYYQEKKESSAPESPWHHLKTIFLVGTIIFLALWILVYTLLSQFAVL